MQISYRAIAPSWPKLSLVAPRRKKDSMKKAKEILTPKSDKPAIVGRDGDTNRLSEETPLAQISATREPGIEIPKKGEYDPWDLDAARNRQKKDRRVKV